MSPRGGKGEGALGPEQGSPLQTVAGKMEASTEVYQGYPPFESGSDRTHLLSKLLREVPRCSWIQSYSQTW